MRGKVDVEPEPSLFVPIVRTVVIREQRTSPYRHSVRTTTISMLSLGPAT